MSYTQDDRDCLVEIYITLLPVMFIENIRPVGHQTGHTITMYNRLENFPVINNG